MNNNPIKDGFWLSAFTVVLLIEFYALGLAMMAASILAPAALWFFGFGWGWMFLYIGTLPLFFLLGIVFQNFKLKDVVRTVKEKK